LDDHLWAKTFEPRPVVGKGRYISHQVDDVEILEWVARCVRVRARAVHDDGADALVGACRFQDEVKHFLFAAHSILRMWRGFEILGMGTGASAGLDPVDATSRHHGLASPHCWTRPSCSRRTTGAARL